MRNNLRFIRTMALAGAVLAAVAVFPDLATASPTAKTSSKSDGVPKNLGVAGQGAMFSLPDPHHPSRILWKLWVKSYVGNIAADTITAHGVTAKLYHLGSPNAKLFAPMATGDTGDETITATGGVTYDSLVQAGTTLRAFKVIWNAKTQRGEAQGNVHYHNGKNGLIANTPVLYFDSGLQIVSSTPIGP